MKPIILITLFLLHNFNLFSQYKHEVNNNGDPLSEIIDVNQMKQGDWKFINSNNINFRTETYKDNTLITNTIFLNSKKIDVKNYKIKNINFYTQKTIKDLALELSKIGNGEIIILEDNTIFINYYYDRIKSNSQIGEINLNELKKYSLQKTIIFF